jgi:peptidoglycan/LPS O-acetylase OafA/YrhL
MNTMDDLKDVTVAQAIQRGNNLVAAAILGLSAFAFLPEFFLETEWAFRLDEGVLFLLGIGAIWWYLKGRNKYMRSLVPVLLVSAAFVMKIIAVIIEFKDKEDVGDDFGAVILFLLATILVIWLYTRSKQTNA